MNKTFLSRICRRSAKFSAAGAVLMTCTAAAPAEKPAAGDAERLAAVRQYVEEIGAVEKIRTVKEDGTELLIVQYVLTPTPDSRIRCGVALPRPELWNGRFCGIGNCGHPQSYEETFYNWTAFTAEVGCETLPLLQGNSVVATTDMGLAAGAIGKPEVWKDFGFRSTHLMTVTAKGIAERYYGKKPTYSYFYGLSTGGGQGMHEAQQFPEDYDGIVAAVPASNRIQLWARGLGLYHANRKTDGSPLFSPEQAKSIARAAVQYYSSLPDAPAYAVGKFAVDVRYDAEAAEEIARIAGELDSTITPQMQKRIPAFFADCMIAGEKAGPGIPMSAGDFYGILTRSFEPFQWFYGKDFDIQNYDVTGEFPKMAEAMGPYFNAENADLSAFAKRGGKLIIYSGTEDCIVPMGSMEAYYERAIQAAGGLENLQKFCLYYIVPGRNHTRGTGPRVLKDADLLLADWCEKGIAPGAMLDTVPNPGKAAVPVAAYPNMVTGDAKNGFKVVPLPKRQVIQPAPRYLLTLSPEEAAKECQIIKYER